MFPAEGLQIAKRSKSRNLESVQLLHSKARLIIADLDLPCMKKNTYRKSRLQNQSQVQECTEPAAFAPFQSSPRSARTDMHSYSWLSFFAPPPYVFILGRAREKQRFKKRVSYLCVSSVTLHEPTLFYRSTSNK